jgi:SNF2 family DNA or RNA helicase
MNSLSDFPHSREHCVEHPVAANPLKHCVNCYCFVCDQPATACTEWSRHCHARYQDLKWRREREQKKNTITTASASAAATNRSSNATTNPPAPAQNSLQQAFSLEPIEALGSLPDLEEHGDDVLLRHIARVHPVEKTPPPSFASDLRHYQKQSLAFMCEIETAFTANLNTQKDLRGGWLASEVGMGKTAVVLALIETNPATNALPRAHDIYSQLRLGENAKKCMDLKATVVITSPSLMGLWEEECRKHAPTLVVKRYHPSSENGRMDKNGLLQWRSSQGMAKDLAETDAIITSATFKDHEKLRRLFEFHRVVVDEAHLMGSASIREDYCRAKKGKRRWCITATPLALQRSQRRFLDWSITYPPHCVPTGRFCQVPGKPLYRKPSTKEQFYLNAETLKRVMIRRSKDQHINGAQALALPESTTEVMYVAMNDIEKKRYNRQFQSHTREMLTGFARRGEKTFALETRVLVPLSINKLLEDDVKMMFCSKIQVLITDLQQMLLNEPSARVVIYSQYKRAAKVVVDRLKPIMKVHSFRGLTRPDKRDEAIREFQSTKGRAAAFVITLRAGSVGITLTTASRVYLMEPIIDIAKEVQAAGRIHRLGQTKDVQVKKLEYKDTIEESIQVLQKELISGRIKLSNDGRIPPAGVLI